MIRILSPETTGEDLLLNGSINQRMATAITAAFIETCSFAETPKPLRLADMQKNLAPYSIASAQFRHTLRRAIGRVICQSRGKPARQLIVGAS